jgi:hypothetical protein
MAPEDSPASTEQGEVLTPELEEVAHERFLSMIHDTRRHGCVIEQEVPCDLRVAMSTELVDWRRNQWVPTGNIVDNRKRWGVRVRFSYWGRLADCLTGRLKVTAWWDGFGDLPAGHKDLNIRNVDPYAPHRYEHVIPMTGELKCPDHHGVYDIAITLDLLSSSREAIVLGHCDLEAIRVTC